MTTEPQDRPDQTSQQGDTKPPGQPDTPDFPPTGEKPNAPEGRPEDQAAGQTTGQPQQAPSEPPNPNVALGDDENRDR